MSAGTDPPAGDALDPADAERLFATLYSELHRLARRELARRGSDVTLGATTLLHEAYLDMSARSVVFPDRARFMAYAARAMRGLIIDYARRRYAQKRGGMFELTSLQTTIADRLTDANELQQISDALEDLAAVEPALAEIVDLKFSVASRSPKSAPCAGCQSGRSSATGKGPPVFVPRAWQRARRQRPSSHVVTNLVCSRGPMRARYATAARAMPLASHFGQRSGRAVTSRAAGCGCKSSSRRASSSTTSASA